MASGPGGAGESTPPSPKPWDNSNKERPLRGDEDDGLMPALLSQDLIAALRAQGGLELEVIDLETLRESVVVDAGMHREAMEALRRQQNLEAIARGFAKATPYPPKVQVFHLSFVIGCQESGHVPPLVPCAPSETIRSSSWRFVAPARTEFTPS